MARTARPETTEAERLLKAAKHFLEKRDFKKCYKYAGQARKSDPAHPGPNKILAISAVLSANAANNYSIMRLPQSTEDHTLIKSRFEKLSSLLNPSKNPFPFASQAHDLVLKAWSTLSDPAEKARHDRDLNMNFDSKTFWTTCPYCYYVFEYENAYVDCCLRCDNANCRRVFHAVALRNPPPPEVVTKGSYACNGFFPVGDSGGGYEWAPFVVECGDGFSMKSSCINISDDEMEKNVVGESIKKVEVMGGIEIQEEVKGGIDIKGKDDGGNNNKDKIGTRRKKLVPRNSKKFMGKGVRIKRDESIPAEEEEEEEEGKESYGNFEGGDDNIFVGLEDICK